MRTARACATRGGKRFPPRSLFRARVVGAVLLAMAMPVCAAPRGAAAAIADGLVSHRGVLQPGVRVWALQGPDFDPAGAATHVSPPTDSQGRFSMNLPRGRYYLVAFGKGGGGRPTPEAGDYYCFYSGNPVVVGDEPVHLGFSLIRVPDDGQTVAGASGVEGTVLFEGKPLGKCYLYVYRDAADDFHGMGFATVPVGADGKFKVNLPPGTYYLMARQRREGGMYGPLKKHDRVGAYYGNPVTVREGQSRRIALEVISRAESQEESPRGRPAPDFSISGTVRDPRGKPLSGLRVLLYAGADMSGKPRFVSDLTAGDGTYLIPLAQEGTWYLVARRNLGGPPEPGELYGRWEGRDGKALPVSVGPRNTRVTVSLTVAPVSATGD